MVGLVVSCFAKVHSSTISTVIFDLYCACKPDLTLNKIPATLLNTIAILLNEVFKTGQSFTHCKQISTMYNQIELMWF